MRKTNNKGFGIIEILMMLMVLALIGVIGLSVYNKQKTKHISATDSTGTFTYEYPEGWSIEPYVWEDCCEGPPKTEPDWTKVTKPITLNNSESKDAVITITVSEYGDPWKNFEELKASAKEDYFAKVLFEGKREDGHEALFSRVDYLGPPDAKVESFTDHRYYFDNGKAFIKVEFREKYHHDWPDDETGPDIDNSKYLADFEHIANSIQFTN